MALETLFKKNTEEISDFFKTTDTSLLIHRPSPNEWSALDCFEHMIVVEKMVEKVLQLPSQPSHRAIDAKVTTIKEALLNFNEKYQTTEMFLPTGRYTQEEAVLLFCEQREKIWTTGDFKHLYDAIEHPFFGKLTKTEWVYFCIYHAQRHLEQMKKAVSVLV